jgi:hypothetical protein
VVALLLTCYAADWTDDYHSYCVAARYSAFETANGARPRITGGGAGMHSSLMAAGLSSRSLSDDQTGSSVLESVFGLPPGATEPASASDSDGRVGRAIRSGQGLGVGAASGLGGATTSGFSVPPQ